VKESAYKKEKLKLQKLFTILKNRNHFNGLTRIFYRTKTLKNRKNVS
jgi:hypothetical protein